MKKNVIKWTEDGKLDSNINEGEDQEENKDYIEQGRKEIV